MLELLTTDKEPLKSFDGIKDADVKELIVDNEGNMDTWRSARAAIKALGMAPEVTATLQALAAEGRLDLAKKVRREGVGVWVGGGQGEHPPRAAAPQLHLTRHAT